MGCQGSTHDISTNILPVKYFVQLKPSCDKLIVPVGQKWGKKSKTRKNFSFLFNPNKHKTSNPDIFFLTG